VIRRKKAILFILSVLILVTLFWFSAPLCLVKVGEILVLNEVPFKADTIIVLSGDDEGQRLRHAFDLYQKGYAKNILLSGGTNLWEETGVDLMERYLVRLGVSPQDVFSEKRSESTVENALYSKQVLEERGLKSALVVTSPPHSRWVSILFKKMFSAQIKVSVNSDPNAFKVEGWWRNTRDRRAVMRELFQIGWYFLFKE